MTTDLAAAAARTGARNWLSTSADCRCGSRSWVPEVAKKA
jgi:hypothetical protein